MSQAEKVRLRLQSLDVRLARLRAERDRLARVGGRRSLRFRAQWIDAWLEASSTPVEHQPRP